MSLFNRKPLFRKVKPIPIHHPSVYGAFKAQSCKWQTKTGESPWADSPQIRELRERLAAARVSMTAARDRCFAAMEKASFTEFKAAQKDYMEASKLVSKLENQVELASMPPAAGDD